MLTKGLCGDAAPFDFADECIRDAWSTFAPAALVAFIVFFAIPFPLPRPIRNALHRVAKVFIPPITQLEAEAVYSSTAANPVGELVTVQDEPGYAPKWRTATFATIALVQAMGWTVFGAKHMLEHDVPIPWSYFLVAVTWLYALARIVHRPPITPPYDLFALFLFGTISAAVRVGGILYASAVNSGPVPKDADFISEVTNLGLVFLTLVMIVNLPFNVPGPNMDATVIGTSVSPEDYVTLWQWISFIWVYPLIRLGTGKKLEEDEVWNLTPSLATKTTWWIYDQTPGKKIIVKLIRANSLDLILDCVLTITSTALEFAGPYFLKEILDGIDSQNPEIRPRLFLYAFLAFFANSMKSESDLQHLWYGRRASGRFSTQLSAAVYQKALKIRDQSGVVSEKKSDSKEAQNDKDKKGTKKAGEKAENPKQTAGADVGKIVNLLGIDVQRVSNQVCGMPMIYQAPFQLIFTCVFLYKILGWSAFAGFIPVALSIPITRKLAALTTQIQRAILTAKDERMKIVNEMYGSIKFIKWFGWEDHWINRVLEARGVEIRWLLKSRTVSVAYSFVWNLIPALVSIMSFFCYVWLGNTLTVATAFTAIRLFDMLRQPLSVLPFALVQYAQVTVSLERLDAFFSEGEVPEEVSSLGNTVSGREIVDLSIQNATFRWYKGDIQEPDDKAKSKVPEPSSASTAVEPEHGHAGEDSSTSGSGTIVGAEGDDEPQRFELKDITVRFPSGKLTVITGPTASGKTALLMALLGEMDVMQGTRSLPKNIASVDIHGHTNSIAYCAQTPWLQQQSIKDNIVFDSPFEQDRYKAVLEACALGPDLARLEDGDGTEIGSKGVSLSGGQKARVALARAVYSRAQYVLLDDPLSAVDSHTARFLYEKLLLGPLLKHRTVLLVTHHIDLVLGGAHYIVKMSDGRIDVQGTIRELEAQGVLSEIKAEEEKIEEDAHQPQDEAAETTEAADATASTDVTVKKARKLVEEEARAEGRVKWAIYKTYLEATTYWTWIFVFLTIVISQGFLLGEKVWISIWGTAYEKVASILTTYIDLSNVFSPSELHGPHQLYVGSSHTTGYPTAAVDNRWNLPDANEHPMFYVWVYSAIGIISALVSISSRFVLFTGGLLGARRLFEQLLRNVTRGKMRWFDTTPTGRILNRFSKDIDALDSQLAFLLSFSLSSVATFVASVATVGYVVPGFVPAAIFLTIIYVKLSIGYLNTGRDLRRMESTARSPILAGFGDLVEGIVTVRAFCAEQRFLGKHYERVDLTTKFWWFTWMLNRWLFLYFDFLGGVSVLFATLFVLSGFVGVGLAGLVIVSAMNFSYSVYWTCRGWTELELALNSVERVVEYVTDVPNEPAAIVDSNRPPAYWPSGTGSESIIVVEDLEVKYSEELPSVLHDVTFSVKAHERVGLLGRTGSGKSTLAMSFLRFADPVKGKIVIDGIDITSIGIQDLRSRITFIPQDATLFAGTIRDNLDPYNDHSDSECLDVLRRVHLISESTLATPLASRPSSVAGDSPTSTDETASLAPSDSLTQIDATKVKITLETAVSAGGNNFSSGQRQLIAMARALLRQNTVVIMDEATSQIDMETDAKIQNTIREEFKNSVLITIAHRLRTVIDYDRLIVLDSGTISESGTPFELIQKEGGIFREMCLNSGSYDELEDAAKAKAETS